MGVTQMTDRLVLELGAGVHVRAGALVSASMTPRAVKERAILAMLALAPGRRRARSWLQDALWGDSPADKGGASFRRALSNIRTALGPHRDVLMSDKWAVWLAAEVRVEIAPGCGREDFLAELDIETPGFHEWRLEAAARIEGRASHAADGRDAAGAPAVTGRSLRIRITRQGWDGRAGAPWIEDDLVDALARRLADQGPIVLELDGHVPEDAALPDLVLEMGSAVDPGGVRVMVRLISPRQGHFLWSGRTHLPGPPDRAAEGTEFAAFLNLVLVAIFERGLRDFRGNGFFRVQQALGLLFTGQRRDITAAEDILSGLIEIDEALPLVQALRGYQRLTSVIELRTDAGRQADEARQLADEALLLGQTNPMVLALAAQVAMKLDCDPERGWHLAGRAVALDEVNPYALAAAGHAATLLGRPGESYALSCRASDAARGLRHEFIWHMQRALAALSVGKVDEALDYTRQSHIGMPGYRPALRYMVALSALVGDVPQAERYAARLRTVEPGFEIGHLMRPDYPLDTFRSLGLALT